MLQTTETMLAWLRKVLGYDAGCPKLPLDKYLAAIPRMECLGKLPSGTAVLIRGDVDAKPGAAVGEGDIRLRSMKDTLQFCRDKGFKTVIFGHIGRGPEKSLSKVAARIGDIMGCEVAFLEDWLDQATVTIKDEAATTIAAAAPGDIVVLQNTRKYDIERVLWKAKEADLPKLAPNLAKLANEFAQKVAKVYIHEAFSAGSLDSSSMAVPAAMDMVALGKYEADQFAGPLTDCMNAQIVIFSGLKIDKLDDLEAMIARGKIRKILTAGSLAMCLKKAAAELEGKEFNIGLSEDPAHKDKPYYIPRERIEQAKKMISEGRAKGIEFIMPVDSVLQDGRASETVGPGNQQFDVGPASSKYYAEKVGEFIAAHKDDAASVTVFHNGVFGMFEDPRFEEGTKQFTSQLKRMKEAGFKVYVGGGEGGTAVEKYGKPEWITYCFTAGGTVLNALGSEPVPYLVALKVAAEAMGPKPHA
jgi:phosphoglycerate kinase